MFVERLKLSYLEKLDLYTDEEVVVDEARLTKKKRVEVLTYLVTKDDKKEMIYKLYKTKKKGWMVYDVDVLGVSIVQTAHSFPGFEERNGAVDGTYAFSWRFGGLMLRQFYDKIILTYPKTILLLAAFIALWIPPISRN